MLAEAESKQAHGVGRLRKEREIHPETGQDVGAEGFPRLEISGVPVDEARGLLLRTHGVPPSPDRPTGLTGRKLSAFGRGLEREHAQLAAATEMRSNRAKIPLVQAEARCRSSAEREVTRCVS